MFSELVDLGRQLEASDKLPPPGFYFYADASPIRWTVHFSEDRVHIEESALGIGRPFSGRTSGIEAHLLVDEASYALGVAKQAKAKKEELDQRADAKHQLFVDLLKQFASESAETSPDLAHAVDVLISVLGRGLVQADPRFGELESKQWVSFSPLSGPLAGEHLFDASEARGFWVEEMERRCAHKESDAASPDVIGDCSVCGKGGVKLVGKLPLKVKITKTSPIHSLNQNAFTSFIAGSGTTDRAHLGICFECGDTAARAFNYMMDSADHHQALYPSERAKDGLSNSVALYWLKGAGAIVVDDPDEGPKEYDLNALESLGAVQLARRDLPAKIGQLEHLINLPWRPSEASLQLSDFKFHLAVVSPNVGRIAVRDWFDVSLKELKDNLRRFLNLTRWVSDDGSEIWASTVAEMVDAIGSDDTNLLRSLLRTAYCGGAPPSSLVVAAGQRLNALLPNEHDLRERQRRRRFDTKPVWEPGWPHALASAIVLGLGMKEGATELTDIDERLRKNIGFQCGQLLALLEEAQQIYTWRQYGHRLDTSLVQRAYGGASTTPAPFFSKFMRQANMAHLPKASKKVNQEVNLAAGRIAAIGKIPSSLTPEEQAQFGLGFYTQRAEIRAWPKIPDGVESTAFDDVDDVAAGNDEQSATEGANWA